VMAFKAPKTLKRCRPAGALMKMRGKRSGGMISTEFQSTSSLLLAIFKDK
jgi:hypothetical protein